MDHIYFARFDSSSYDGNHYYVTVFTKTVASTTTHYIDLICFEDYHRRS